MQHAIKLTECHLGSESWLANEESSESLPECRSGNDESSESVSERWLGKEELSEAVLESKPGNEESSESLFDR